MTVKERSSHGILMKDVIGILTKLQQLEWTSGDSPESLELRQTIPAPILGHYDRLRARGKKGVAVVRNGVCGECHLRVPIGVLANLVHRSDIQLCNCGRYLYLAEEIALPTVAALEPPKRKTRSKKSPPVVAVK